LKSFRNPLEKLSVILKQIDLVLLLNALTSPQTPASQLSVLMSTSTVIN